MSLGQTGTSWLRQTLAWSNSAASWRERLVLALFLLAGVGLAFLSWQLSFWPAVASWVVYAVAIAVGTRQGWLQLFGPVLFYDMIRTARQSRYVVLRLLYASTLLSIMFIMYVTTVADRRMDRDKAVFAMIAMVVLLSAMAMLFVVATVLTSPQARFFVFGMLGLIAIALIAGVVFVSSDLEIGQNAAARAAAQFAEFFFLAYMIVQLALVALLTPAYVAGAIADEKDRKTLEFMLATDLSNHEIVLSKLLSRVANVTLLLLTGLPILSILQFVGGVDADLMLSGFAGTGLTMLGIASVGILFSTLFQKPRDAIGMTYLALVAYFALGTLGEAMVQSNAWLANETIWYGNIGPTYGDVSNVINSGNPIAAMIRVAVAIQRATLAADLPILLTNYAIFHGALTLVCVVVSILRVRAVALKQTPAGTEKPKEIWAPVRPNIGTMPMLWKELYVEGRFRFNWLAWAIVTVLVFLTLGSGVTVIAMYSWDFFFHQINQFGRDGLAERVNIWFRIAGTGVECLMLLIVAVRASTAIASERERDTMDALLTTPISCESILFSKLLGCVTGLRLAWLWYGAMVLLALITGGLHPLALPLVIGTWFVYAIFYSMIGLWFSMTCQSSMRATVLTVLAVLFLGGGHWIVMGLFCFFPMAVLVRGGNPEDFLQYLVQFELGMTPPWVLGLFAYSWEGLARDFRPGPMELRQSLYFSLVGLALWGAACAFLWYGLLLPKFREQTRREDLIYQ